MKKKKFTNTVFQLISDKSNYDIHNSFENNRKNIIED